MLCLVFYFYYIKGRRKKEEGRKRGLPRLGNNPAAAKEKKKKKEEEEEEEEGGRRRRRRRKKNNKKQLVRTCDTVNWNGVQLALQEISNSLRPLLVGMIPGWMRIWICVVWPGLLRQHHEKGMCINQG